MIEFLQWLFLSYFVLQSMAYLTLYLSALRGIGHFMTRISLERVLSYQSGLEPPISILVPAYNEAATIVGSVRSLLQIEYPEYEVIVINDGSRDTTLDVLKRAFDLVPYADLPRQDIATRPLRGTYRSLRHPNLRVIDKDNGGKADSLNAGINTARSPLFCGVDADSILERNSLLRVVRPFLDDPTTVAAGGTVRIANGCEAQLGFMTRIGLPRNFLALCQVVEYLRAFLFGRLGWEPVNALLIISGAFGVFHKDTVVWAGGYRTDTVGEDMELVVRLHRLLRAARRPYRISFVPDPICWTEAPESMAVLRTQRARWHRGLSESLMMNRGLLFSRHGGAPGWLAFPFMILFEWLSPVVELAGYIFMTVFWALGLVSWQAFVAFLFVALGVGVMLSVTATLLEEMSFHVYPKRRQMLALLGIAVLENFGYRQINSAWRLLGLWQWATRRKGVWGRMTRKGNWQSE